MAKPRQNPTRFLATIHQIKSNLPSIAIADHTNSKLDDCYGHIAATELATFAFARTGSLAKRLPHHGIVNFITHPIASIATTSLPQRQVVK